MKIYWNERGAVSCGNHAPHPGTDTWVWEKWSEMTDAEKAMWARELSADPRCECDNDRCGERV